MQLLSGNLEPFEHFENPILTLNGEERIIRWHNSILIDNESGIVGVLSSGEDVTEYKKAEEETRVRNVAMDSSLTPIIITNPAGYITYVNSAFVKLWSFSDEKEILGKSVRSLWNSGEKAADIISEILSTGGWAGELTCRRKDGTEFCIHLSASPVTDEAGKVICIMGSILDMTKHKEAEQMMIEARIRA